MAKFKVELNTQGIIDLLKDPTLEEGLRNLASANASGGWQVDSKYITGNRPRVVASIYSTDKEAIEEELDTHRLVGGLHG